jgi:hypothetical protein
MAVLPRVVEAVSLRHVDFSFEEIAEVGGGEEFGLGAVGDDAAFAHEEDAFDFGEDVGDVVGDEEDAGALLGEFAEEIAEVGLCGEVEGVRGFVEQEHLSRSVRGACGAYEGAADHDAALLASGHFAYRLVGEGYGVDLDEDLVGAGSHGFGYGEVWPKGGAGKEAGENGVATGGVEGGAPGELGGDDAEAFFKFGEVPAFAAEDADFCLGLDDWVALAGDGLDEGGLAAAVGAEDGDVLAGVDGEVDVVEDDVVAACHVDLGQMQERRHSFLGYRTRP